ncbi:MAG: hypothetical protein ACREOU_13145 [Candidatus Eiseniibacteriota bacterium]
MSLRSSKALSVVIAAAVTVATPPVLAPSARADHTSGSSPHSHAAPASTPAKPASKRAAILEGMGKHQHKVTTKDKLAQKYFDQGLTLVYGFNHEEAIRSFEEAARIDSTCAMAYWGIALAYGPNINLPIDPERERAAYAAIERAQHFAPGVSEAERGYIEVLSVRYSERGDGDRKKLDEAYVDAMRKYAQANPKDTDAQVLFAEALMNLRPWDHWTKDGKPQPGTEELIAVLEGVLAKEPNHPGANHYYIHSIEASPHPEKAVPSAERLTKLVPGGGHLVHMPAHIWMRTGRYADASKANAQAYAVDEKYLAKENPGGIYPIMYTTHNIHFLWASQAMEGKSSAAIASARGAAARISADMVRAMPMAEFVPPTTYFALVRFGKYEEMMLEPPPPADLRYTRGMWHYGRGMALSNTGRAQYGWPELDSLLAIRQSISPDLVVGINSAQALLAVAGAVLRAEIASFTGQTEAADTAYKAAIALEDDLKYDEPPGWYQPTRQLYGAWLLDQKRGEDAERIYREDLVRNPENGWSLFGLSRALLLNGKPTEAAEAEVRFKKAWAGADVTLQASRF